jgi:hypothetical protein
MLAPRPVKPFGKPAFFQKSFFKCSQLPVQQVVCLVDDADEGVGGGFRGCGFNMGLIGRIGPIRPIKTVEL